MGVPVIIIIISVVAVAVVVAVAIIAITWRIIVAVTEVVPVSILVRTDPSGTADDRRSSVKFGLADVGEVGRQRNGVLERTGERSESKLEEVNAD